MQGCIMYENQQYEESAQLFEQSLEYALHTKDLLCIVRGNRNVGQALIPLGCDRAVQYFQEACSVQYEIPQLVRAEDLYRWAFCLSEVDQVQYAEQIQLTLQRLF